MSNIVNPKYKHLQSSFGAPYFYQQYLTPKRVFIISIIRHNYPLLKAM